MSKMKLNPEELVFIPLGGSEQFGANLNVYGYRGKLLAIDMGIGFADNYYPGVDILLPDPAFLEDHREDIVGLIITHAHEDHVGAVSRLWPRIKCPIYCTKFTATILRRKMDENPECKAAKIHVIEQMDKIDLAPFTATFVPVCHSIPSTSSILLETDLGRLVHSGDWNLDPDPVLGEVTSAETFTAIGDEGVLAYIGDSTNAGVDGYSGSEGAVEKGLAEVFKGCKKRIVVTIFASNIGRIQSVCRAAAASDRHVAVLGHSLHRMIGAARECGYLNDIADFIPEDEIPHIPRENLVVIATGSQGEARAQIARIARGDQRSLRLDRGDTVIFSARPIPGNEKEIIFVQNRLAAAHVNVINPRDTRHCIHVSGHPAREEIKQMYAWIRPKIVVPVHGEKVMIENQAALARSCQVAQTVTPNNGSVIRLAPGKAKIIDHVETGLLAVEPGRVVSLSDVAISDRRKLQYSGTLHASVVIDDRGDLLVDPQITAIGLIDVNSEDGQDFIEELMAEIEDTVADLKRDKRRNEGGYRAEKIRIALRRAVNGMLRMKTKVSVHLAEV